MKYKLIGDMTNDPTDSVIPKTDGVGTTLVHVVASGATELIQTRGGQIVGRIYIPANGSIDLSKEHDDAITCPNSFCTPIAYQA
jgi:hypothetical protein